MSYLGWKREKSTAISKRDRIAWKIHNQRRWNNGRWQRFQKDMPASMESKYAEYIRYSVMKEKNTKWNIFLMILVANLVRLHYWRFVFTEWVASLFTRKRKVSKEAEGAKMPLPPEQLVEALNDAVPHIGPRVGRVARTARNKKPA